MIQDFDLHKLVHPLLQWFRGHARVLPWREEPTPYRVWVSEIMLQQTRVEAVKPYFERFIKELPDIAALAACEEEKLLKLWEGLGYYNRVRNMKEAAAIVMENYQGQMPEQYEELLKLKGIGHYTAGAVSSIAYGKRAPAVDGNVFRIITRVTADDTDIGKQSFRGVVEQTLMEVMPEQECGSFNQALMELGATVCVPNGEPHCVECPWQEFCLAHLAGEEMAYPVKTKAKPRKIVDKTVFVIRDNDKVVLRKRPEKGLLAGMYEFPGEEGHLSEEEAVASVKKLGFVPLRIQKLEDAKHIFSHVEWHMKGFVIRVEEVEQAPEGVILVDGRTSEEKYPVPAAFAKYMKYMNIRLGNEKFEEEKRHL